MAYDEDLLVKAGWDHVVDLATQKAQASRLAEAERLLRQWAATWAGRNRTDLNDETRKFLEEGEKR